MKTKPNEKAVWLVEACVVLPGEGKEYVHTQRLYSSRKDAREECRYLNENGFFWHRVAKYVRVKP